MMPNHQAMLEQLRTAGPNFDVAFRDAQVAAHQEALALHQNYANGGDLPALRTVAGAAVPIIQQHLVAAQGLNVAPMAPSAPPPTMQPGPSAGERG
jgi:putative membrane protein